MQMVSAQVHSRPLAFPYEEFPLMIHRLVGLACVSFATLFSGCSSTSYSSKANIVAPKTIKSPPSIPPEIVPYVPRFVELLQSKGFSVGRTEDPRALELLFEFNANPFNMRVSAGLWREGLPILTASATNSGFGTVIARGGAVGALADSALVNFQIELDSLAARTQIVPDAPRQ
jgi:hypothetical protein